MKKRMTLSAINIAIHPHPTPEVYISIFKRAAAYLRREGRALKLRGDQYALLDFPTRFRNSNSEMEGVQGQILKFTQIDVDGEWLDIDTLEGLDSDSVKDSITIPDNLKPNLSRFSYALFPRKHIIVFQIEIGSSKTSASSILKFFENLFNLPEIKDKAKNVNLTIIPDKNQVEKILAMRRLQVLRMTLKKPNPDDLEDLDAEFEKILEEEGAALWQQELVAEKDARLTPTARTQAIAKLASNNGEVWAKGRDTEGKVIIESTKDHAINKKFLYELNRNEMESEVFVANAESLVSDLYE